MRLIIATLLGIIAVVGGFACGFGVFAYGIWLIVLMIQGNMTITFANILLTVACWFGAVVLGYIWGLLWGFLAAVIGGTSFKHGKHLFKYD